MQKPEWKALFSQSTADEVLNALCKGGEVKQLMNNLFRLADKEGITAMNIDADRLLAWITDVIDQNNVKIVFIWDNSPIISRTTAIACLSFRKSLNW